MSKLHSKGTKISKVEKPTSTPERNDKNGKAAKQLENNKNRSKSHVLAALLKSSKWANQINKTTKLPIKSTEQSINHPSPKGVSPQKTGCEAGGVATRAEKVVESTSTINEAASGPIKLHQLSHDPELNDPQIGESEGYDRIDNVSIELEKTQSTTVAKGSQKVQKLHLDTLSVRLNRPRKHHHHGHHRRHHRQKAKEAAAVDSRSQNKHTDGAHEIKTSSKQLQKQLANGASALSVLKLSPSTENIESKVSISSEKRLQLPATSEVCGDESAKNLKISDFKMDFNPSGTLETSIKNPLFSDFPLILKSESISEPESKSSLSFSSYSSFNEETIDLDSGATLIDVPSEILNVSEHTWQLLSGKCPITSSMKTVPHKSPEKSSAKPCASGQPKIETISRASNRINKNNKTSTEKQIIANKKKSFKQTNKKNKIDSAKRKSLLKLSKSKNGNKAKKNVRSRQKKKSEAKSKSKSKLKSKVESKPKSKSILKSAKKSTTKSKSKTKPKKKHTKSKDKEGTQFVKYLRKKRMSKAPSTKKKKTKKKLEK